MAMDRLRSSYNIACQSRPVLYVSILAAETEDRQRRLSDCRSKVPGKCTANCDKSNICERISSSSKAESKYNR